jgi:1-acyl-sn-glycerol-3-phosphate acyltransferase
LSEKNFASCNLIHKKAKELMKKFLTDLFSLWALLVFVTAYLCLFPFFALILTNEKWHKYSLILNKIWSSSFYLFTFLPYRCERKYKHDKKKNYIFCANHTSFLDISIIMLTVKSAAVFIGKSSLGKIPVFGYMFNRLHIPVNRQNNRSRYDAFDKAKTKLELGLNVIIFPEGGITTKNPPFMAEFKDGAFRIAIEKQVSIVPVSIIDNYKVLPDKKANLRLHWGKTAIIYHEEISTEGMTLEQLPQLREAVYRQIHEGIMQHSVLSDAQKQNLG